VVRGDLRLWLGALACALVVAVAGSQDVYWNGDFYLEAFPAYKLLMAGDVHGYLQHLPGYTGFALAIGAPASLLTSLLGGAETMVFRLCALPGLVALAGLAVALAGRARLAHLRGWPLVLLLTAAGPLVLQTLKYGHPEDLLATAAAVGAVLVARDGRPTAAGLLLVVAVLAKQWAVLAIGPALLAAPAGHWRIAVIAALGSVAIVGAEMLYHPLARGGLTSTADLFHPHQVWWPFGVAAPPEFTAAGHGVRTSPDWLRPITHPLIVALALPLTLAAWRRPDRSADDAFALLALLFLARCALDPWNLVYYHLPLVTALIAWEVRRGRDWPLLGLATSAAAWLSFVTVDDHTSDLPFLVYMAWTIPLAILLVRQLYAARAPLPSRRPWPVDPTSGARRSSPSTSTT
jgi:Glycosyltransferase family 87